MRGRYKRGDVLVASTGEGVLGKCVLSEEVGYCDSHVSILRPKSVYTGKFIFYWLSANYETVNALFAKGSTKQTEFQKESFLAFKIGFPPLSEQIAIADYLDRQTTLIDQRLTTLADKKAVLAELRKATIHEAVTKGLNKTVQMKDSGVAWIGAVPSHWARLRIKDVCRVFFGQTAKDASKYVGLEHITPWLGTYKAADRAEVEALTGQFISAGVMCFSKLRPYLAKAFVANEHLFVTTELLTFVPCRTVVDPSFLTSYLLTHGFIAEVNDAVSGTKMPRVDWHTLATRTIFLPPIDEQLAIADHLDQQTQQIDAQLTTLDEQAQVLKELRKAIIHEVVTGKIDLTKTRQ